MPTAAELTGASTDDVAAARSALTGYVQGLFPTLAVRAGPLADLVLGPAADALAAVEYRAAAAAASLDPEAALAGGGYDEEVLAAALAGRGVTRGGAAAAAGDVALHFTTALQRTVQAGYRLETADGVGYKTTTATRLLPPTATALAGDVLLAADPGGGYTGVVPVAAEATGAAANRPAGTALAAATNLAGMTAALAATDLAGGADAETDAALLARLPSATAPRTVASRAGAEAVVRAAAAFSAVATLGFGDDGMRRGRSVLSSQTPGRLDVRVRVADAPGRLRVRVTATLENAAAKRWRFTLAAAAAPGWYRVEKVVRAAAALTAVGYALTATPTAGYDLADAPDPAPDIAAAADASLSRYATATVRFTDTDTATGGLTEEVSTAAYDAVVRYVPGVAAAQAACDEPDAAAAGGDCLVRAAVPVRVAVTAAATPAAGTDLSADELAAAVAAAVNAAGIDNRLSAAAVAARAQALLPAGTALQLSGWAGTVYPVSAGTYAAPATADGLALTTDWTINVGEDSVAYYCDPEDVAASISD